MSKKDIEKMKAEKDVDGLIEALEDKDMNVRYWAARSTLGEIRDKRAIEPLRQALKDKKG